MGFSVTEAMHALLVDLIREAQAAVSNETTAMNELLRRYEPLARGVVARMAPSQNDREDLLNGARWGLVKAVRNHDGRAEGFTAFLTRYMQGEAFRAVERTACADLPLADDAFPEEVAPRSEPEPPTIPTHLLNVGQRRLVRRHYWEDQTYAAIAHEERVSLSAVRQRMLTIHRTLASGMASAA
jgi:DNA-directed RNA polymerase specialized sigma24 family protein